MIAAFALGYLLGAASAWLTLGAPYRRELPGRSRVLDSADVAAAARKERRT